MKHEQIFPVGNDENPPSDLVTLVQRHARIRPDKLAYVFLDDGEREGARLTFGNLDRRARAIAAQLQPQVKPNARALLLFPPGLDYIEAFFGCLYAGVIAVPAYPPSGRHLQRLNSILADADPSLILTTQTLLARLSQESLSHPNISWCATDVLVSSLADDWKQFSLTPDAIAFLQYTSGSTGDPRGVMVSHGNLIANEALIKQSFHHDDMSTLVGWLPLYHDMGLIGNILQPLYSGATSYLMSPMAFLEKPVRWLAAISKYRAHTSGGPNFGFEHCVRKIKDEDKKDLDLSSWRIAFSGAEPVRATTLERFANAFAAYGFRKESFYPCYGLAEATLVVSAPSGIRQTPIRALDKSALAQNLAADSDANTIETVGCGHVWPAHDIRIVDPNAMSERPDGAIGEIWVSGPSVAKGYWRRDEQTGSIFEAQLAGDDSLRFLRTGDLGFLDHGELFITGRLKELIIIAGRNYYPHDIENIIEDSVDGLRLGGTTAVQWTGDEESYVVFAEPRRVDLAALRCDGGKNLIQAIRIALANAIDLAPRDIVLLKPGSTPKTSSGKTRRVECRRAYLAGEFDVIASMNDVSAAPSAQNHASTRNVDPLLKLALTQLSAEQRAPLLVRLLVTEAARLLRIPEADIQPSTPISQSGIDSLKAVELRHAIERALGDAPPLALLLSDVTFLDAAKAIASFEKSTTKPEPQVDGRLSFSQQAMWMAQQIDADSIIYNLHFVLDVGVLDVSKFTTALADTLVVHDQLRTLYQPAGGSAKTIKQASVNLADFFELVDAHEWDDGSLQIDFARCSAKPFDLEKELPLRVTMYRRDGRDMLLFVAHHIAVDFWSLLVFLAELDARYRGAEYIAQSAGYATFTARQHAYLGSQSAKADWDYWRQNLSGQLPLLELPRDFKPRGAPNFAGASKTIRLDRAHTAALLSLAKREAVSLFSLLLTGYFILLQRYNGQRDMIVGVPTSGRLDADFTHTIGNFANPVAIRATLEPGLSVRDALALVQGAVRSALSHQEFPFPVLVERLRPARAENSWPIYQTTFVLQKAKSDVTDSFASLALGEPTRPFQLFGQDARPVRQHQRVENFDLKVAAAMEGDELLLSFQYRTQCFADATIESFAAHYACLLQSLPVSLDHRIDTAPIREVRAGEAEDNSSGHDPLGAAWRETVVRRFEAQTRRAPTADALIFEDQHLSYGELNRRANQLARHLRRRGAHPEKIVAISLNRGPELLVAVLGVMKSGAAYLPIDPTLPADRISVMLEDSRPLTVVTQSACVSVLPSHIEVIRLDEAAASITSESDEDLQTAGAPANLAYVLFTSGSTGRPKAVAIENRALSNCVRHFVNRLDVQPTDRWLAVTTISFDIAALELFAPLTSGAAIVLADPGKRLDPLDLSRVLTTHSVTIMQATPSLWSSLLDSGWQGSKRLTALAGGERVSEALSRKLMATCGRALNVYGPTETTIWSSDGDMQGRGSDLGCPIADTEIHLLNTGLEPAPVGAVAEAFIGGRGLARGYLGRPDLTADRFVPDPNGPPGARLYRTGDLVHRRPDGGLDYRGRRDDQVKVRGFRIEIGEIEAALLAFPGVSAATVVAKNDSSDGPRLCAYVAPSSGSKLDARELRSELARILPDYMTPSAIVILDALPISANGKVDKNRLPEPGADTLRISDRALPATPMEAMLLDVWAETLGVAQVGILDNFFDIGGDSIRAIQMATRLRRLGHEVTPRLIFQYSSVHTLARFLEGAHAQGKSAEETPTFETTTPFALAELDAEELARIRAAYADADDVYRLTPLQEGMLLHSLAQQGHGLYHLQERYYFHGVLDVEIFFDSWRSVVARHDTLRTSFHLDVEGRPYQLVHSRAKLPCAYIDLSELTQEHQTEEIEAQLSASRQRGFDLCQAPLLRIHLMKLGPDLHLCVRDFHHIILDDWCTSPLILDVRRHYAAALRGMSLNAAPPPQFRDYIAWLRRQDVVAAQAYWTRYLTGFSEPTPLVIAKAGEQAAATNVDDVFSEVSTEDFSKLKALARAHRLTINTFVQAAVGLLLCRYAGSQEAVFGVTVAGRPAELPNSDIALGLFINGLPLRVRIAPEQPVLEWLKALLADNVEMRQHEFVSQSAIQQWSEINRADSLLFQHLLTFENAPIDQSLINDRDIFDISLAGLRVHTNYPITFVAIPGEALTLRITYDRDRFDGRDMHRMIRHWRLLIVELVRNLDGVLADLAPLEEDERKRIFVDRNRTEKDYGTQRDLIARFEAQVSLHRDRVAAACCGETLTFDRLNQRANRLAHSLIAAGFGQGDFIAIFEDRGLDFLVSMLAIFKCGAAYLPIDPAYPDGRIAGVLEEAHVAAVLAGSGYVSRAAELTPAIDGTAPPVLDRTLIETSNKNSHNPPRRHTARSAAFVIYTSGSTGKPKGAIVEHRGMFNNLITKVPALELTSTDIIAQTASQCFDISVWQFLLGLAIGARVEILPDDISRDPEKLVAAIARSGITVLEAVPSMIRALLDTTEARALDGLRWLIPCGEAFTPELCRRVMAQHPSLKLLNAYGPAECSDDVTYYPIVEAPAGNELSTPIGHPVDNCQIYVLDRWLEPIPIGAPGEICVAGVQVGRGYLHRPDLTANAFRPDPFGPPGSVLYRTGDLGRWRDDGVLDFLGRVDHQVKIRGHRIEPGEIEACLVTHPTIEEACVIPRPIDKGVYQLVAYVVGVEQDPSGLRAYLAQTLPDFMLPSFFVFLDKMPLSPNGKIDRRRLPTPEDLHRPRETMAPRSATEETLCEIWKQLLVVDEVGVEDNFFELGGHSLLAIQLRSRIQSAFDVEIPLKDLFSTTTVESLAYRIEALIIAEIDAMSEVQAERLNAQYTD